MKLTIFAKRRTTKEGKPFYTYLTTLKKKTGEKEVVAVKFTEEFTPNPKDCPMNIEVDKGNANLSNTKVTSEDGREIISKTLWVKGYELSKEVFKDTSLDEYE